MGTPLEYTTAGAICRPVSGNVLRWPVLYSVALGFFCWMSRLPAWTLSPPRRYGIRYGGWPRYVPRWSSRTTRLICDGPTERLTVTLSAAGRTP